MDCNQIKSSTSILEIIIKDKMGTDHTLSVVFRYTKLNCKKNLFLPEISLKASPIKPIATTVGIQSRNVTPLRAEGVIEIPFSLYGQPKSWSGTVRMYWLSISALEKKIYNFMLLLSCYIFKYSRHLKFFQSWFYLIHGGKNYFDVYHVRDKTIGFLCFYRVNLIN